MSRRGEISYGDAGGTLVICPYYKHNTQQRIVCEGPMRDTNMSLQFGTPKERRQWMEDFCKAGCWRGCLIAAAAAEKYGE